MERRAVEQWSVTKSLALLAAIFAIVIGATLPTAVAASAGVGYPVQLCSGARIFVLDNGSGDPADQEPASAASLECAVCLAAAFVAVTPPPVEASAATVPCLGPEARPIPAPSAFAHPVRLAPRPPSTAPPIA